MFLLYLWNKCVNKLLFIIFYLIYFSLATSLKLLFSFIVIRKPIHMGQQNQKNSSQQKHLTLFWLKYICENKTIGLMESLFDKTCYCCFRFAALEFFETLYRAVWKLSNIYVHFRKNVLWVWTTQEKEVYPIYTIK